MSAKKPISSKLGKQETDRQVSNIINEQDIEKEQKKMSSKRLACSHPRINNGEPVFKKSKQNLNKSNIKTATDIQNMVDKKIESVAKCSKDSKSNFLQPTSSSSDSDDDDMDEDGNDSDDEASDDALDEKILNKSNVSKQTKDKKLTENSGDDDSSDEDSNEDDDVESYSGKDNEQDFSPKKISGKRVNEIESGDEEDSDDQSDSEVEEDSDSDENSSNNSEEELLGNDQTAAVNSERKGVSSEKTGSESLKNQHSVIKDDKQTEESDEVDDNDDSDEDSSEDADDSKLEDDISDGEIGENAAETNPEDELEAVKKELANIPLEDLMKIKEKLGLKVFNKIMHGGKFDEKKNKVFKRDNKNRPMELSSKRKVRMLRQTDVPKEKVRRDPRFDDLSGEYQEQHFTKNYSFLNDIKAKEKLLIQKKMKKTKDENKKQEMAKLLNRMTQQEQTDETKRKRMELEKQWKEKERQHIKEGKTPYFLKKSDKKKLELAEKFKELQKSGQIDTYMGKRLKKNAQKEKKKLPGRHQRLT